MGKKQEKQLDEHKNDANRNSGVVENEAVDQSSDKALVRFDPLQRYLTEISQYKLLTRERERELAIRVREYGDDAAAYELITSNLRLVVKIALDFQRIWMQNLLFLFSGARKRLFGKMILYILNFTDTRFPILNV